MGIDATHLRATPAWPGGFFASLPRLSVLPGLPRARARAPGLPAPPRRPGRSVLGLPARPARPPRRPGRDDHRGRRARPPTGSPTAGRSAATRAATTSGRPAAIDAALLRDVRDEGYAGGVLFEWVDEWFKHTWNTADHERPYERRQLWRNVLTNEEHFGVLAAEPGARPRPSPTGETASGGATAAARSAPRGAEPSGRSARWRTRRTSTSSSRSPARRRGERRVSPSGSTCAPAATAGCPGARAWPPRRTSRSGSGRARRPRSSRRRGPIPWPSSTGSRGPTSPSTRATSSPAAAPGSGRGSCSTAPTVVPSTGEQRPAEVADLGTLPWGTANPRDRGHDARVLAARAAHGRAPAPVGPARLLRPLGPPRPRASGRRRLRHAALEPGRRGGGERRRAPAARQGLHLATLERRGVARAAQGRLARVARSVRGDGGAPSLSRAPPLSRGGAPRPPRARRTSPDRRLWVARLLHHIDVQLVPPTKGRTRPGRSLALSIASERRVAASTS